MRRNDPFDYKQRKSFLIRKTVQDIPIYTTISDLEFHYSTIAKVEKDANRMGYINTVLGIVGATLAYLGLMLTPNDFMIGLKAMLSILISLAWIFCIFYYLWQQIQKFRKKSLIKKIIDDTLCTPGRHYLSFDTERIVVKTENQKLEYTWEYFTAYFDNESAIFLFPVGPLYSFLAFTDSEIGKQNVQVLREMAQQKLSRLKTKIT